MDNINQIFGAKQFFNWLLVCNQELTKEEALERMERLVTLQNRVWKQIGDNLKKLDLDSSEHPVMFNFNPFLWIKYCFENKDKGLLVNIVTLYSSILRRLKEKQNMDAETLDRMIENEEPIHFSDIRVGKYPWSPYVLKAYEKFEKSLPLPSRKQVIEWENSWGLYVRFINSFCPRTDLNSQMSETSEIYKNYLDPNGTDSLLRKMDKQERKQEEQEAKEWAKKVMDEKRQEFISITLKMETKLKSVPLGISKYEAIDWIDNESCKAVTTLFDPSEHSFRNAFINLIRFNPFLLTLTNEILIIVYFEKDAQLSEFEDELDAVNLFVPATVKVCGIKNLNSDGSGIEKIDLCYR